MSTRLNSVSKGVSDAWDFWLSQHDISVPEIIELAVNQAVAAWFDDHTDELIEAIAKHARILVLPAEPEPVQTDPSRDRDL
jgi:hypothetical protein